MNINIAVVDDNLADSARLCSFIRSWFALTMREPGRISCYQCGTDMLRAFVSGYLHIIFMDIIMNDINGIETAHKIRALDPNVLIVFLTTSKEFVFEAFPVHAFDYIIKPCTQKKVNETLSEAYRILEADGPEVVIADTPLHVNRIASVEAQGHGVKINLADGKSLQSKTTFQETEQILSQYSCFIRCNRGIIVNMSYIASMTDRNFEMKDGRQFPIRINGASKIKEAFSQFLIFNMRGGTYGNNIRN